MGCHRRRRTPALGGDRTLNYPAGAVEKTGWIFEAEYDTERVTLIPGETCPFLEEGSGSGEPGSGSGEPSSGEPSPQPEDLSFLYYTVPIVAVLLAVCACLCIYLRRRAARRSQITRLWQQHIQDASSQEPFLEASKGGSVNSPAMRVS